ncbi:DEAD/DEAH box helicase [Nonomuraea guangzhouensis]|uniref:DEAD/DEAH box helicase n=1 Tax=Nonomuraea guangzhouensis TaxID=1291555 RepID=A0ABW4GQL1_9ACTN|nr:DEAD/DEAH box helicase family protein [Nonomuraea guangzhouensis]
MKLSDLWFVHGDIGGNTARRLVTLGGSADLVDREGYPWAETSTGIWRILFQGETHDGSDPVLRVSGQSRTAAQALKPPTWEMAGDVNLSKVVASFEDAFRFRQEDPASNLQGLREPQLGAVHAVLGHWASRRMQPATVVMPTGTGKTETMVALLVAGRVHRLLVIVPSDALRDQIAGKFERLGLLRALGVVTAAVLRPIVGRVKRGMQDPELARRFAEHCNVIVATTSVLQHFSPQARDALMDACSHMFIDEAHHVAAPTWRHIRDQFAGKHIVQFTATPFRSDGADLGGRVVFGLSLKEARRQGYFSKITYAPVVDLFDPDRAVAERAVELLRADLAAGHDHILMARVKRIGRAIDDVLPLYQELAPDLNPVILHSKGRKKDNRLALEGLHARTSKIVVCVDMLGEGFDLPALKVAAIHDQHKSIGITLQFIGRFARVSGASIGQATVVVNRTEPQFDENLKKLYAEDADWNDIIEVLSARAVGEQEDLTEFEEAFAFLPEEISLRNLAPRMSTVVYRTSALRWAPEALAPFFGDRLLTDPVAVNERDLIAWLVAEERRPVAWGTVRSLEDISHDLYVLYWDRAHGLLYINSSNTESVHPELAQAVAGEDAALIKGPVVYRIMAKIRRCVPTNVGTLDARNRSRRFQLAVGADVLLDYPEAEKRNKSQTNIFVSGFEGGERVNVGASLKGRVWNYGAAPTLKHWVDWCDDVGAKLTDATLDPVEILKGFIIPEEVHDRPKLVPLTLEWPTQFFLEAGESITIKLDAFSWPLIDADLTVTTFTSDGAIGFTVSTPCWSVGYQIVIADGQIAFTCDSTEPMIFTGRKVMPFSDFLHQQGLRIMFEDEAILEPDMLLIRPAGDTVPPFSPERLQIIDWSGINLSKESQGADRDPTSIQARTIQHLLIQADWDLVIDDDGAGEVADIVAARVEDGYLHVNLVHCKYAHGAPGARVADLYEVCGQVHKSTKWRHRPARLFHNLVRREGHRRKQGRSGLEKGTDRTLHDLAQQASLLQPKFTITIVQPGVSKARVSNDQLHLLACAEVYAMDTANSVLHVIVHA